MIPHGFFPRSAMDMAQWTKPMDQWTKPMDQWNKSMQEFNKTGAMDQWKKSLNTLDMFDSFDQLDHTMGRNMQWLNKPECMLPAVPTVPQKYRITLDCMGYSPASIKTECKEGKTLCVWGCEKSECTEGTGDFHMKEFKKTYTLPEHAQWQKMVSFMTAEGQLVIEMPLSETTMHLNTDLFPQIIDNVDGGKRMWLKFNVPSNIHPEHVHINIKDRCLVVKAEEKKIKPDGVSTFHYYKKTTLPENTNWDQLKCTYADHQISVTAPINLEWTPTKHWENKGVPMITKKCPVSGEAQKMVL
jgi:HSP20 family molecular chaperone IbpA